MRVRLLGTVDVVVHEEALPVPGLRRRALLAALAVQRGVPVDRDVLIRIVWPKDAPSTVNNALQSHISFLRTLIGDRDAIQFRPPGYVMPRSGEDTDLEAAQRLIDQAAAGDDLAERARRLTQALALWRGPALSDVAGLPWLEEQASRLEQLRIRATHSLVEARLALGDHADLVPELERLVREHPFDEHLYGQLMVALYRSGRQADALAAYQQLRSTLQDELGVDPNPELRALETRILRQDEALRPTAPVNPTRPVPATLPPPPSAFVGRAAQLSMLDNQLGGERTLVILTIAGTAGAGKTALAVHWAHRIRDRFPDGQLFVDLRGFSPTAPVRSLEALTGFLVALGMAPEQIPVDLDQATALYRSLVAGRRLLIVLDNASSAEQVRPLLPGEPGCLVLVTSRNRLGGLVALDGAQPVPLEPLTPTEAGQLLTDLLGRARVADDPASIVELARTCAHLPLALRIAAATLLWQPGLTVGEYVEKLRTDALQTLTIDGDPEAGVVAAFDASYTALPDTARRVFALLSLHPGPTITAASAGALAALNGATAARLLVRLAQANLITEPIPGRYACHDLLRAYAGHRCAADVPAEDRRAATVRLYDWWLAMVNCAADLLYPHMLRLASGPAPATFFADHAQALDWLDVERPNLVAAITAAGFDDFDESTMDSRVLIADGLRGYFHLRRHGGDWLAVGNAALAAATARGDLRGRAAAQHSIGTAWRCLGELTNAHAHYREALRLARRARWTQAEATLLGNLGIVSQGQGRLGAAVTHLTQALELDRQTDRRTGLANNLTNLAMVLLDQGRLNRAIEHFSEALPMSRKADSRHGQALALTGLGRAYRETGRPDDALAHLHEALRHCTDVGDRDGLAYVHIGLSHVELDLGHPDRARDQALVALVLAQDGGDPRTEADALILLGSTVEDCTVAYEHLVRVDALARQTHVLRLQLEALVGLADAARRLGRLDEAARHAGLAVQQAARSGFRVLEANARTASARVHLARGQATDAAVELRRAVTMHRRTGHRPGERHALDLLATL